MSFVTIRANLTELPLHCIAFLQMLFFLIYSLFLLFSFYFRSLKLQYFIYFSYNATFAVQTNSVFVALKTQVLLFAISCSPFDFIIN